MASPAPAHDPVTRFFRYLVVWTVVCSVSAAPSFLLALGDHEPAPMLCGVAVFILAYTLASCSSAFHRFRHRPFVNTTLWVGYATRMVISLLIPAGIMVDVFFGMFSINLVENGLGLRADSFTRTFLITCIQGTVLNIALAVFMCVVFLFLAAFGSRKPPPENICTSCGYDLRASPERCPECGTPRPANAAPPSII